MRNLVFGCYARHVNSRITFLCVLLFCAVGAAQQPTQNAAPASSPGKTPVLTLQGLGNGMAPIDGDWQFHLGDDPLWSQPALDDSNWEAIKADAPWG